MEMERPKMEEEEKKKKKMKCPWMKSAQLLEFQVQALVYRYIEAGLPVPQHLLVPIWNSLACSSSSSSSNNFIHHNHHSSLLSDKGYNHIFQPMDPEATRCRRTDGKKWRCSYTVLPFQKYCQRHMHRGRKSSRKLVESSSSSSYDIASSSKRGFNSENESQAVTVASFASTSANHGEKSRRKIMEMSYDDFIKQRESSSCVQVVPVQGVQKFFPEVSDISLVAAEELSSNTKKNDTIARSKEWKYMNGLFPSVNCVETDNEPRRCRRTDGKKWRCSKNVISGQKYCEKHMHRGIKKKNQPLESTNSHENSVKTPARSVTVLGIPLLSRVSDEKSNSSCSSDTTITDTALRGDGEEEEDNNEEVLSLYCSSGV